MVTFKIVTLSSNILLKFILQLLLWCFTNFSSFGTMETSGWWSSGVCGFGACYVNMVYCMW
ncbi:hypothetical protein HanXRQr2_Chr07g0300511 [Helianthus annuus]|uniref:Uncharacterized protein n=1 Tax=Helianthus annuus TaxID=4232 RepID=A0A9K3NG24_HELAN|nr:hypothetical protein HanXRQr2_Chr07g0300511 [Helianthus annuus]